MGQTISSHVEALDSGMPNDQHQAARILSKLARGSPTKRERILEEGAVPGLVRLLAAGSSTATQARSATALGRLAEHSDATRAMVGESSAIPLLVCLLYGSTSTVTRASAMALGRLAENSDMNRRRIVEAGAIPPIVRLLAFGIEPGQQAAALALGHLASTDDVGKDTGLSALLHRLHRGDNGLVASVAELAKHGSELEAIAAEHGPLQERIGDAGAVPLLVRQLATASGALQEAYTFALMQLAHHPRNRQRIAAAGGIFRLVRVLSYGSQNARVYAALALGYAIHDDAANRAAVISCKVAPHLMQLLASSVGDARLQVAAAMWLLQPAWETR